MTLRKNIIYTKEFTVSLRGGRKKQGKKKSQDKIKLCYDEVKGVLK